MLKLGQHDTQFFRHAVVGGTQTLRLVRSEIFDLDGALAVFLGIVKSLRQLHLQIELHQALCPANMQIAEDGSVELRNDAVAPLGYISPEQTGRMNRGVDYRSDYYSLGVVFYELLTGRLPFTFSDPMELVHSHIARQVVPPSQLNPDIAQTVSDIVVKLLSKNAEDRYQSLDGLWVDLKTCQTTLRESGSIPDFPLGQHDVCDRLQLPQRLYGRESETAQLLGAFNRIAKGGAEMLLVTGYSGIGKSSLVNEIHKPVVFRRGYFIAGKFDQFKRNIPYFAVAQAFREFVRQILTESESRIFEWKTKFLNALGPNGQLMVDAIPDLEYIIGKQPEVARLGATESQNRFNYVVQNFVGVCAQPQHPLVIFLDDMQWADEASLKVIQLFMTGLERPALLLIGSYRDNEVAAGDSLMLTIDAIKKQAKVSAIEINPLSEQSVTDLVADTVKSGPETVAGLAQLIYRKTRGNPFFVGKFIRNLYNEQLLTFLEGQWHWNINEIEALQITDNVIELLTKELGRLPSDTQNLLRLAACMGSRFDFRILATLEGKSKEETKALLQPALQAGLIMTPDTTLSNVANVSSSYRFLHDRVQQAAYAGIPEAQRKELHLQIGRLLYASIPEEQFEERLFDIVQQLNEGKELIGRTQEKHDLAELNLLAARKGKSTVAYETAFEYATVGIALLEQVEESYSPLYFALQLEQMETGFLSHRFQEVDQIGQAILQYATDNKQKAMVFDVLIHSMLYQDRHNEGKALAFQALQMLGVEIPDKIGKLSAIVRLLKVKILLRSYSEQQLLDLPMDQDALEILKQKILSRAVSACYVAMPAMFPVLIFEQVSITLRKKRYTPDLPWAVAGYAMVLIHGFGDIPAAYKLGNMALALVRKNQASMHGDSHSVRVGFGVYAGVFHWKQHLATTVAPLYENYRAGLQTGEFEYAVYSLSTSLRTELILGRPLPGLLERLRMALAETNNLKQKTSSDAIRINIRYASMLMGADNDDPYEGWVGDKNATRLTLLLWHLFEASRAYLFGDFDAALYNIRQSEIYNSSAACMCTVPVYHLYHSLCLCASYAEMDSGQRHAALDKMGKLQKNLKLWAHHAPMNYLHKWQLVEAERARILRKNQRAADHYDLAIAGARANGYLNDEALANELAARFYIDIGKSMNARMHMEEAYARYREWGAHAKLAQLEQTYPDLLARLIEQKRLRQAPEPSSGEQRLDMDTIIKASQTLSGEIQLDSLLKKLMALLIENAGAQKGILLLQQNGALMIQARIAGDIIEVQQAIPVGESTDLSLGIINYVKRTREKVVLGDAGNDSRFNGDPYIARARPKSVLCISLQKQSELVGILYLENNLAVDAFTPERLELLQILSTQIAISLENAGLYNELEQKIEVRTQALSQKNQQLSETLRSLRQTQQQLVESAKLASLGQLVAGVAHEINTPVGVGVTAASTLAEETEKLSALYLAGSMKRSDLDSYVATAGTISKLLLSNMDRAATLIQSFKEVAIDQTSEEKRTFRLRDYMDEVLLNLSPMLKKHGHKVTVSCSDTIEIDTYPGALSQVLTNFVMNALLHAFAEGTVGAMSIAVDEPDADTIELRFSDNGKGIPEENLPKIFDPFFTTMRGRGGSGLGLNIIHNLVTGSLQGTIRVESKHNSGTTFILKFPRNAMKIPSVTTLATSAAASAAYPGEV